MEIPCTSAAHPSGRRETRYTDKKLTCWYIACHVIQFFVCQSVCLIVFCFVLSVFEVHWLMYTYFLM